MSSWSQLPNAVHIDRVLDSLNNHTGTWRKCGTKYIGTAAMYQSAKDIAIRNHGRPAWYRTVDAVWAISENHTVLGAAEDAVTVLIAYDDSAHLLDSSPDEIRLLVALGHPYAALMLPAATVLSSIAKKVL